MPTLGDDAVRQGLLGTFRLAAGVRRDSEHPAPLDVVASRVAGGALLPSRYAVELGLVVDGRATQSGEMLLNLRGRDAIAFLLALEGARSEGPNDAYCLSRELLHSVMEHPAGGVHFDDDRTDWPAFLQVDHDVLEHLALLGCASVTESADGEALGWQLTNLGETVLPALFDAEAEPTVLLARGMSAARSLDLELTSALAHRLHNTLTPLGGDLSRLQGAVSGDSERWLRRAQRAVRELQDFAEKTTWLAEHGERQQTFDIGIALIEARDATATRRNGTTKVTLDTPEANVRGPRHRFVEMMAELITNACHAGATLVALHVASSIDELTIDIRDDGCGVDAGLVERLFERGVSGRASTGFGLAMARQTVERMAGRIELVSPFPTHFRLHLPATGAE